MIKKKRDTASKIQQVKQHLINPKTGKTIVDGIMCIYVPCNWPFVYRAFMNNFLKVVSPVNMVPLRQLGIATWFHMIYPKFPICKNRNMAVMEAKKHGATHMLFLDSDMTFPPDIAIQLKKHNLPVVAGMYWHQSPPHLPVIYKKDPEKGRYHYLHYHDYPRDQLFEVDLTGMGCMLVDMEVINKIEMPYFDYRSTREDDLKDVTEDVVFCEKIQEAGYQIMIDPSIQCNHLKLEEINQDHFDAYMSQYKSAKALLEQFGEGNDDDI